MSKIELEINFLYQKILDDITEDDLYQTMYGFLNYLDKKGYHSLLSKHKLIEYAKTKKICNKVDKAIWTKKVAIVFGTILNSIKNTYKPNGLYFKDYSDTTTNVYGLKSEFVNNDMINFKKIVTGSTHLLMLTSEGSLYSMGSGSFGQLGQKKKLNKKKLKNPLRIKNLPKIKYIASGFAYNCVISEEGNIYSWGAGENGRLGLGDTNNRSKPVQVTSDVKFKSVACGSTHTVALSTEHEIYSWGNYNATGHVGNEDYLVPKKIKILEGRLFQKISIGVGSYHTVLLSTSGKLIIWGHNRCGQLGIGENIGEKDNEKDFYIRIPVMVSNCMVGNKLVAISNYNIIDIASGWGHSMFLTSNGKVFTSGRNCNKQLGFSKDICMTNRRGIVYYPYFKLVEFLKDYTIIKIFAGGIHSAALTDDNRLIFWGDCSNNLEESIIEKIIYPYGMSAVYITKQYNNLSDVHLGNMGNCIINGN
tara:strand:- start:2879 stop:4306 length:1428 start_codon:yes stop_codon:yes gene_type:complete